MKDWIIVAEKVAESRGIHEDWCSRLKKEVHLITLGDKPVVEAAFYKASRGTVTYCNLWVHLPGPYIGGHGQEGGAGSHKAACALQEAIRNAGFSIIRNGRPAILGGGHDIRDALVALARLAYPGASRFGYFEL